MKVLLHSTGAASHLAALLLGQILPVFSLVPPCQTGVSPVSVRRWTFTTDCYRAIAGLKACSALIQVARRDEGAARQQAHDNARPAAAGRGVGALRAAAWGSGRSPV